MQPVNLQNTDPTVLMAAVQMIQNAQASRNTTSRWKLVHR
jgi:hypothetical protein